MVKSSDRLPLLVILGPTAVGKSAVAMEVAKRLQGEIISADSAQVYRGMDIGTDKPSPEDRAVVPHHLIDLRDPDEGFSVAEFQALVFQAATDIVARGHLPMLVGGTALYIKAVVDGYAFVPAPRDDAFRAAMWSIAREKGPEILHARLAEIDPARAATVHPRDAKRIIRALEVHHVTGKPFSEIAQSQSPSGPYDALMIGLWRERGELYRRIDARVDQQIARGLVLEVGRLLAAGYSPELPAMAALGYKEVAMAVTGRISMEEAIRILKRNTRHFARRQLVWWRREPRIRWIAWPAGATATEVAQTVCELAEGYWKGR